MITQLSNPGRALAAWLCLLVLPTVAVHAADAVAPVLTDIDTFELEYGSDPQISPDGEHIVYVRNSMDIMVDGVRKDLWIIDVASGEHRPLVTGAGSSSMPRWSPGGKRLAYVASSEGDIQIFVRWLDTGQTARVSNLRERPSHLSWAPNGRQLAFVMAVPHTPEPLAKMPAKPEGATWAEPAQIIDSLYYRADGRGYLESAYRHLFVVPADGGTPRQLTEGQFHHNGPLGWADDGKRIVFSSNRQADWEYSPTQSDIFSVAVADGGITRHTDKPGPDYAPTVSANGRFVAYLGAEERNAWHNPRSVWLLDLESGTTSELTADFDRSIADIHWAGDRDIWFSYLDAGQTRLARVGRSGGVRSTDLTLSGTTLGRPYTSGDFSVAAGGEIAFTRGSTERPADIAFSAGGKAPATLTALNDDLLGNRGLGQVERIVWQSSHDQQDIEGWLVTPPGFDPSRRYPLILEIHGGPHAAYGPNFSAEVQLYAAAGYVVLYANPRGSTGYGDAFASEINRAYPGYDYDDLMSGVDAVLERGFVDPENLFVTGGSGGGVLTAWIVGKTNRFRAAVVAKPVINWISFALTADNAYFYSNYLFDKPVWEDVAPFWERSPLSLVGNVTTPTMLLTGEVDYRTPMSETEQYYQALKNRKVDTLMVRIQGASHGIAAKPSNLVAKVNSILAWFARYRTDLPEADAS